LISTNPTKDSDRTLRFVKPVPATDVADSSDFIKLSANKKRKRDDDVTPQEVDDYRSVERAKEASNPSDSDIESEYDTEVDAASTEITQRNSTLIQRTRDQPNDLDTWLELVDHQEAMMRLGRVPSQLSSLDRRNLADVRISTYEQAIKKVGNDPDKQIRLHLGMLGEALRAWDDEKLTRKWSEVLEKYPSNQELWIKYLDFAQSRFSSFKHDTCRRIFHRCLKTLLNSSKAVDPGGYLHVLIRITSMIRDSGYQELAISIWQAVFEFHLMGPDTTTPKHRLKLFEEFWESEIPRIGEADAKGWKPSMSSNSQLSASTAIHLVEPRLSAPVLEDFTIRELDHMKKLKYPGRTTDDVGGDDPFHLVLFSDIEEYLQILPSETPASLVLEAFLCFSGMPRLPARGVKPQNWWLDPFLQRHLIQPKLLPAGAERFSESLSTLLVCQDSSQITLEALFDHGFPEMKEYPERGSDLSREDLNFIRRVLKLLVTNHVDAEIIGEYLLAFESNYFPDESFKTAKQLLKARPTSLRLYNAYGLLESRRNKHEKAEQVYCAALSMHKNSAPLATPGTLELYNNWVWEALKQDGMLQALWRLLSPQGDIPKRESSEPMCPPDPSSLLRGRTILSEAKERALLGRDFPAATVCTSLLALLAYLCAKQDPYAGLEVYAKLSDWFLTHGLSKSPVAELLAQYIAQFLVYHATHASVVKPALIRDTLDHLIDHFPDNTVLLSVFAANEARFPIDDRVRGIMRRILTERKTPRNIAAWLFAINYEMQRGEIAGSTSNSVRALFIKAEDDIGAHCPALWESHLLFELKQYNRELAKRPSKRPRRDGKKSKQETRVEECYRRVRETFFQGLTHLPWSKDYMMLAFSLLGSDFLTEDELRRVYNVMIEKELRLYVDVEL
jgi:tetratricopeptide (TPR) repeat protein